MILNAEVLTAGFNERPFFDQMTGAEKPGGSLEMTVLDADTDEKYEVQIAEGFLPLDEWKDQKSRGAHPDVLRQLADQLRAQLPGRHQPLQLEVIKLKGKQVAFLKLVCRLVGVPATA